MVSGKIRVWLLGTPLQPCDPVAHQGSYHRTATQVRVERRPNSLQIVHDGLHVFVLRYRGIIHAVPSQLSPPGLASQHRQHLSPFFRDLGVDLVHLPSLRKPCTFSFGISNWPQRVDSSVHREHLVDSILVSRPYSFSSILF